MKKVLAIICLIFTIIWYSFAGLIFILYCIETYNNEVGIYYTVTKVLEEWFSTINLIVLLIFLLPGIVTFELYKKLLGKG